VAPCARHKTGHFEDTLPKAISWLVPRIYSSKQSNTAFVTSLPVKVTT